MSSAISIILPCLNPGPGLRAALASVWEQRSVAGEVIVVDGGSTDGSVEWLRANQSRLGSLVAERDGGIYDAMNKGVGRARGEWILFLGADDRLVGDLVLAEVLKWAGKTEAGVVAGEAAYDDGRIYRFRSRVNPVARNFVHHQCAFYRRALFAENGGFDPTLTIAADYDFNLRLWRARVRFKPIPVRVAACGTRGASDGGAWSVYREEIAVRHRHFPAWRCWWWDALSVVRFGRKQLVRGRHRSGRRRQRDARAASATT